jgi:hypothetical protein
MSEDKDSRKVSFPLGQIVQTAGVANLAAANPAFAGFIQVSLRRHSQGDWGNLDKEDKKTNELALINHLRLLSEYEQPGMPKIWIITEATRLVTTILFPDEY